MKFQGQVGEQNQKRNETKRHEKTKETLKSEINTAKIYLSTVKNVSTIVDVYQHLNTLKSSFKCLIHFFIIAITLPISTASNERLFSALI